METWVMEANTRRCGKRCGPVLELGLWVTGQRFWLGWGVTDPVSDPVF